ncbi:uncharacterized protein LOC129961728 [Argiope bruennichi]|uniref:uncharacterized protein LOC129961728 n=1 Tax=Argiope bruennichi TaxID=94029 RepID=UPI0024945BDC|nr:uncharacterized protein LOC129961728 [Argiope bruennichi]
MEETRYRLLREGYLDIKPPPDSPERILHKAWRRLWVRAIIFLPQSRGEPHLILQLCRKAQDDEPMKQVKASRDGLRLFRCRSGSRPLQCWGVASGSTLLLYLAAATEQLTQEWMHTLREGLWPTMSTNHDYYHEVSLIDDEKSFSSGLLGVYGRLVKTSEMTLSIIHPHWQGTQMRWRLTDVLDVRIVRRVEDEDSPSGVFSLTVCSSSNKDTRVLQFYSNTAVKTVDWLKSILPNIAKDEPKAKETNNSETVPQGDTKVERTNLLIPVEPTANYATIQKTKSDVNSQDRAEDNAAASDVYGKVADVSKKLSNIPDAFLNASTSSLMLEQFENSEKGTHQGSDGESDDSSSGSFDHIYEDLEMIKDSRSYTVYEKVDDDDDVYVPHAPFVPPKLPERAGHKMKESANENIVSQNLGPNDQIAPARKQNLQDSNNLPPTALRLQKLCESVSEALKQAEEPSTPAPLAPKRPSFIRKIVGKSKSKSHHASPTLEKAPSPMHQPNNASTIKRAVSESDLTDTKLENTDLPFRPFDVQVSTDNQRKSQNEPKQQNHVPLEDLLKNMKMGDRRGYQHHRRGVSEGGKIVYEIDKYTKYLQVRNKNEKRAPSTGHSSDQQEGEYIDMT